jgi:hypothetical protein
VLNTASDSQLVHVHADHPLLAAAGPGPGPGISDRCAACAVAAVVGSGMLLFKTDMAVALSIANEATR